MSKWEATRIIGKRSYILLYGTVGFGLWFFVGTGIINMLIAKTVFTANQLIINLFVSMVAGGVWGVYSWHRIEDRYKKSKDISSGDKNA